MSALSASEPDECSVGVSLQTDKTRHYNYLGKGNCQSLLENDFIEVSSKTQELGFLKTSGLY